MHLRVTLSFCALISPVALLAQELSLESEKTSELLGSTIYTQEPSPFNESGFNNVAALDFRANIGEGGSLVFRCTDGVFLQYINPLGSSETVRAEQRLGDPDAELDMRLFVDGENHDISARVSPTGLSLFGDELKQLTIDIVERPATSQLAFSFIGRTGEVISARFLLTNEDKSAFSKVANNCSLQ